MLRRFYSCFHYASLGIIRLLLLLPWFSVVETPDGRRATSGLTFLGENSNISALEELLLILDASSAPLDEWTCFSIASSRLKRDHRLPSRGSSSSPVSRLVSVDLTSTPPSCSEHVCVNQPIKQIVVMDDLDKEQLAMLRKVFDSFDHNKKGSIPSSMVRTIFIVMGHRVDDRMLRAIIAEVDADGSGELEFSEFVTLAAQFLVEEDAEEMQNELKEAFRLYDKEGNGYITTSVLREILHELDDKLTPDDLDGIIAEIDEDGSGTIDFDEFMEMMTGE